MHDIAVALLKLDAFEGDTELRREHLRKRAGVALTIVERSGDESYRAVLFEYDLAELDAGRRRDFEVGADRDPPQLALLAAFFLALGEIGVIGDLERLVEHALEIAAVVGNSRGRGERHLRGLDKIALAQRQPVDAHFLGGAIDQAL